MSESAARKARHEGGGEAHHGGIARQAWIVWIVALLGAVATGGYALALMHAQQGEHERRLSAVESDLKGLREVANDLRVVAGELKAVMLTARRGD